MNNIKKQINLNVQHPNNYQIIHAMQGDNDTIEIEATIWDGNKKYEIDCENGKIEIDCISPSNIKHILNIDDNTANTVTFKLDKNVLAENGEHELVVHFMSSPNLSLTTFPSTLFVCNAPTGNLSESEFVTITEYVFAAKKSADEAEASASNAKISETNAAANKTAAANSASEAATSATNAANSATSAATSATTATNKANAAAASATNASNKATEAGDYAKKAQSYAVGTGNTRPNEAIDSAKYYYEQSKAISETLSGALRPMGTVTFVNLPALSDASEGDMYNISDQFTTNANFKEGSNIVIPAGANVYKTADGKWDILAGTPVTSVNGQTGNVNITSSDIGALSTSGGEVTGNIVRRVLLGGGNGGTIETTYGSSFCSTFSAPKGGPVIRSVSLDFDGLTLQGVTASGIDETSGGTEGSSDLITSGAVNSAINGVVTEVESGDDYININRSGNTVTITHQDVTRKNGGTFKALTSGDTFDVVKSVTSDSKGHLTGVQVTTIALPEYTERILVNPLTTPTAVGSIWITS